MPGNSLAVCRKRHGRICLKPARESNSLANSTVNMHRETPYQVSWAIIFPGNVQAYLVTNSGYFVHNGTRDPKAGFNLGEVLVNAYDEAFQ